MKSSPFRVFHLSYFGTNETLCFFFESIYLQYTITQEQKEIDRWLELYETHDKYTFVGHLIEDPVNEILEHIEEEDAAAEEEVEELNVDETEGSEKGEPIAA